MTKKKDRTKISRKDEAILYAFLATFLSIIGFVVALIAKRDDEYVMHYAKISLVVFIIGAVAGILSGIFLIFPIIGKIIQFALGVIVFIIWLLSWFFALSGERKSIPIVSDLANKFKL